jgi:hypothetical protein
LEAGKMTIHFMQEKIIWQNWNSVIIWEEGHVYSKPCNLGGDYWKWMLTVYDKRLQE